MSFQPNSLAGNADTAGSATVTAAPLSSTPASLGLLAWNFDIMVCNGGAGMGAAGDMMMVQVPWTITQTVTNVVIYLSSAGTTLTANQCLAGVYSSGGTLLATTVNQATTWASTGWINCALTSPTSIPAGTGTNPCVYAAFFWNGTSQPSPLKGNTGLPQSNGNNSAATKRFCRGATGQTTTLPASVTMSSNVDSTASAFWVGLS